METNYPILQEALTVIETRTKELIASNPHAHLKLQSIYEHTAAIYKAIEELSNVKETSNHPGNSSISTS